MRTTRIVEKMTEIQIKDILIKVMLRVRRQCASVTELGATMLLQTKESV